MKRIAGILGGMGPQATVDLMSKVIDATPARHEADHVHMIVDCNPHVPPRTAALLGDGASPGPELARMARGLVDAGATVLAMPCNTAHAFIDDIEAAVDRPVLHMIDLATDAIVSSATSVRAVGLVATRGTRRTRLYHDRIERRGWTVLDLDEADQARFDVLIEAAKTRRIGEEDRAGLARLIEHLSERGADVVVAGCTEAPLILPVPAAVPVIDPTTVLAQAIVAHCHSYSAPV